VLKITSHGYMLHKRLRDYNCRMLFNTAVKAIEANKVTIETEGAESILSPIDQVIVAVGLRSKDALKATLAEAGIPHVVIGDARQARRIIEATEEGARAAWEM